jgi:hypothetical protein
MAISSAAAAIAAEAPPQVALLRQVDGIERRAAMRAVQWWRELAAPRHLPSFADVVERGADELWPHLFGLEIGADAAASRFVFANAHPREAIGRDPSGLTMAEAWPAEAQERALFLHEAACDLMGPIDESGRWSQAGDSIVYRCVLLPFSDDQRRVSHLVGAFSYRRLRFL